jgi:GR25 family glycosyltransferase involved in LPS biosynthesis
MKKVLGAFSHAFVINLESDRERMAVLAPRLHNVGIEFERFQALQFEGSGKREALRGANMSHLGVVREARRRKLENVLIMEDDAVFRPDFLKLWAIILPQLQTLDYDIFYGYSWHNTASSPAGLEITALIAGSYCAHFWAIHSCFYDSFIESVELNEQKETPLAIDTIFTHKKDRVYAPTYNLVGQDAGISLITKKMKPLRWSAAD